jgi:hypothetical protein
VSSRFIPNVQSNYGWQDIVAAVSSLLGLMNIHVERERERGGGGKVHSIKKILLSIMSIALGKKNVHM